MHLFKISCHLQKCSCSVLNISYLFSCRVLLNGLHFGLLKMPKKQDEAVEHLIGQGRPNDKKVSTV